MTHYSPSGKNLTREKICLDVCGGRKIWIDVGTFRGSISYIFHSIIVQRPTVMSLTMLGHGGEPATLAKTMSPTSNLSECSGCNPPACDICAATSISEKKETRFTGSHSGQMLGLV